MKRYYLIILLLLCTVHIGIGETLIRRGALSGTWTSAGSPYYILGNVGIREGEALTVEPGVEVIFYGQYKFLIGGQLLAEGTPEDSIYIHAENPDQGWRGFRIYDLNNQADTTRFSYCRIENGNAFGNGDDQHGGALFCSNSSKLVVEHCCFSNNQTGDRQGPTGADGSGIGTPYIGNPGESGGDAESGHGGALYLLDSDPLILHNLFMNNLTGDGIGGTGGAGTNVDIFSPANFWTGGEGGLGGKGKSGDGGAIYCLRSSPLIFGNMFDGNSTGTGFGGEGGAGGDCSNDNPDGWATGGNGGMGGIGEAGRGGAIYLNQSNAMIQNNLFYNDGTGNGNGGTGGVEGDGYVYDPYGVGGGTDGYPGFGGDGYGGSGGSLYCENSSPQMISNTNTLENLGTGIAGFSGGGSAPPGEAYAGEFVYFTDSNGMPSIQNSIIWGNDFNPAVSDNYSIEYSCVQGGYSGSGNIDEDPLFVSQFLLSQIDAGQAIQSPCVDSGNPASMLIDGTTRSDGFADTDPPDMGYHHPLFDAATTVLNVYPSVLIFNATYGYIGPDDQYLLIDNMNLSSSLYYEVVESIDWLDISASVGGPLPPGDTITVSVDVTWLSAGTYVDQIEVISPDAIGNPQTIEVTLNLEYLNSIFGALSGTVSADTYTVIDDIFVNSGNSLLIEAGTVFYFLEGTEFQIAGFLHAEGMPEDSIKFVPAPVSQNWEGICFNETGSNGSQLDYCYISGSNSSGIQCLHSQPVINHCTITECYGAPTFFGTAGGGLCSLDGIPTLNNCEITGNDGGFHGGGIYCYEGGLHVDSCKISMNVLSLNGGDGGGVYCYEMSGTQTFISNSEITENWAEGNGGGLVLNNSSTEMSNCSIYNNSCNDDGGGVYVWMQQNPYGLIEFYKCLIAGNSSEYGGGIDVHHAWNLIIENCTFSNNSTPFYPGGAMYLNNVRMNLINTIIEGNNNGTCGGIYLNCPDTPTIEYSCFFENETTNIGGGTIPSNFGVISTTNANGDPCDQYYNIFMDPQFVESDSGDFNLLATSPCIDAGDPLSPLDPDSTIADIGAFYYDQNSLAGGDVTKIEIPDHFALEQNYPNPFNPTTVISYALPEAAHVTLTIFNINGQVVETLVDGYRSAATHRVTFDASHLSSGLYFYKIEAGQYSDVKKMVLVK